MFLDIISIPIFFGRGTSGGSQDIPSLIYGTISDAGWGEEWILGQPHS